MSHAVSSWLAHETGVRFGWLNRTAMKVAVMPSIVQNRPRCESPGAAYTAIE